MFLKTLHVVSITFCVILGGCGQNPVVLSGDAHNDGGTAELGRQDGELESTVAEKETQEIRTDESTVIVYYFHRTIRCIACITIESVAAEVIEGSFQNQLADGRLIWMRINLDDEDSRRYEEQFDVSGSTLVVAKVNDRNGMQYKKLSRVWDLLSKPQALSEHIDGEITEYLNQ